MINYIHQKKEYDYQDDIEPIYNLLIKQNSFMVCFNKPYFNRHNMITYPVKTISFNKSLYFNLKQILNNSVKYEKKLKFIFVFHGVKSINNDFDLNIYTHSGDYFIYMNVAQFAI